MITVAAAAALLYYPTRYRRNKREGERQRLKEAQRGGVELFQVACILLPFDHYIIASHAAPAVHSCSHSCACAFSSSSSCRWRVSNQYVAYQPVTVHPARGNLVLGHLCYEFCSQACQPGGSSGAPHCQLPRYVISEKWDCIEDWAWCTVCSIGCCKISSFCTEVELLDLFHSNDKS